MAGLAHFGQMEHQIVARFVSNQQFAFTAEYPSADGAYTQPPKALPVSVLRQFRTLQGLHLPQADQQQQHRQDESQRAQQHTPFHVFPSATLYVSQ